MKNADVIAVVPFAMLDYFEKSGLQFYGYGSRFNTQEGAARDDLDGDLLVACDAGVPWKEFVCGIEKSAGIWFHHWRCGKYEGYKPETPVLCNYRHECHIGKHKNAVCVRQISDPETDLYHKGRQKPIPSDYTKIGP